MKNKILLLFSVILITGILTVGLCYGESITSSMSGPELLRANDTLSVTYSVEGVKCYGFQGYISYNSEIMTLSSAKALKEHWVIELTGEGRFIAYSKNPMEENTQFSGGEIFVFEFLIDENTPTGATATLEFTDVVATDSIGEFSVKDAIYKKTIDPPASNDATIKTLFITNASYSPAFSPETYEYTIPLGVGYDVTSLDINAVTSSEKASYTISGNDLRVGNNRVIITVTAETGITKEYIITFRRAHSPEEPLSDNTKLSQLVISDGMLTPAFSPDIREYIVYLPNQIKSFKAIGTAEDEFARSVNNVDTELVSGLNDVIVSCTAENYNVGEYLIHVVVMPEYIGIVPDIQNSIPFKGSLSIEGVFELNMTLTAVLNDGYDNSEYEIVWYRNGEAVHSGSEYTLTEEDKECFIMAVATGRGFFSGSVESTTIAVMKNGTVYDTNEYIPTASYNIYIIVFILVIIVGFTSSMGIILGIKRARIHNDKDDD